MTSTSTSKNSASDSLPTRVGRPGLPPGRYFRLLLIGYFEGLDAERAMAWRAADSFALREFLGLVLPEAPPDHSTISRTRRLIDLETHERSSRGCCSDWPMPGWSGARRSALMRRRVPVVAAAWSGFGDADGDVEARRKQRHVRRHLDFVRLRRLARPTVAEFDDGREAVLGGDEHVLFEEGHALGGRPERNQVERLDQLLVVLAALRLDRFGEPFRAPAGIA
jgi:hypothetical protein